MWFILEGIIALWQFGDRWCCVVFLQVQTPPHEWEVAVVEKLHSRLQVDGFYTLVSVACTHMIMCDFILSPPFLLSLLCKLKRLSDSTMPR